MHCERCNIDFPEGLRYCKWCGGPLKERSRDTSELKTCPSCKAAVKPSWAFCKSCGAKLSAADLVPTSPVGSEAAPPTICSNCGEQLDAGSLYCKGCGSPVQQAPYAQSSLLCATCNSYSPIGSLVCSVCGAPFAGPPPQATERSRDTLVDLEETTNIWSDPAARSSHAERPRQGTVEMVSGLPSDKPGTQAITSSDSPGPNEAAAATGTESTDELKTITMQADSVSIETDADEAGSSPMVADIRDVDEAQTSAISDGIETLIAQSVETTMLDQGRTTSPVEGESAEEEGSSILTMPISDPEAQIDATEQTVSQPEQPVDSDRTDSLGTAPPVVPGEQRPESLAGSTIIIGSEASAPPPAPQGFSDAPTRAIDEPAPRVPDPRTAPFGLNQYNPQQETVPVSQQPWQQHQSMPAPAQPPETRVMPLPPQHMPPVRKPVNIIAIVSIILGVAIVAGALLAFWWYMSGRQEPAAQQEVVTDQPATEPAPAPPPAEVKPPPVPEGMALVPGGKYIIGRDDGDELARPQRVVEVRPFYIDLTEVTNAQYMLFVDAEKRQPPAEWVGGTFPEDRANWPVTGITWQDAADYAAWAGKRLPTEIEWEVAARGSDGRIFPWGNEWKRGLANIGTRGIREVGQYKQGASPFGPLDMLGNVWEWTADELALYPGSTAQLPSSIEPGVTYRVIRGGAYDGSKEIDATYRGFVDASKGYSKTGFRCVKDID